MTMTTSRDATSRLRQTLNPLMTSLGGFHNQMHTPHSAVSVHSSYPYSAAPAQTPASSIQPYNPQEWGPSPAHAPERTHTFPQIASVQETQGEHFQFFPSIYTKLCRYRNKRIANIVVSVTASPATSLFSSPESETNQRRI